MSDTPHDNFNQKDATLVGTEITDNMPTLRIITSTTERAAVSDPADVDPADKQREQPIATVPREIFNYALIAFLCLVVGVVFGWTMRSRMSEDNNAVVERAVQTVVAAVPSGPTPVPTRDPNIRYDVDENGNPARGVSNPENALITMIEFGDFRCGYCRRFNDETLPALLEQYEGQIRFVYRDYPILTSESRLAAMAAECAHDQGKFWEFHDWAYGNQNSLNRDGFITIAENLDMNIPQFTTCFDGQIYNEAVTQDFNAGLELGITGTPTFFINGKMVVGAQPLALFQQVIDAELAEIASSSRGA